MSGASPGGWRCALFSYGFRPFFLLSGVYAVVAIAVWQWLYRTGTTLFAAIPPQLWHAHEMLFGFVAATIAGFMLTAVPSWTGSRGFAGMPLLVLSLLWLLGRVAFAAADSLPSAMLVAAELAFLPALILLLAPSLLRSRNRNTPLLLVLAALWLLDAAFLLAAEHGEIVLARRMLLGALDLVLLLITVIGGRIVPAFTSSALKQDGMHASLRRSTGIERLTIGAMILLLAAELLQPAAPVTALIAALAAIAHLVRLAGWQTRRTLRHPIVWILHAAYLWLPIGLGLRALYLAGGYAFAAHWLHALSIGAAATMIMAVMTRAALGHSGRPLRVSGTIVLAYAFLLSAAAVRVFAPAVTSLAYSTTIAVAAGLWIAAFSLFIIVYAPILTRPRADGRPG